MKFLLNRFTIRTNLIFTFSMVVFILIIIFAISLNRKVATEKANKIFSESIKVKNYLYKIERDEHKFRTYKNSKHIEDYKKHLYRLIKQIDMLKGEFKKFDNIDKTVTKLKKRLFEYKKGFQEFIKRRAEIDKDRGVIYYLRVIKNEFLIKNREVKNYDFSNNLLILELIIKNYIISHNTNYSIKFSRYYEKFRYKIIQANIKNRDELIYHLDEYKKYFAKLIEISTIIGNSQEAGIIGDMRIEVYKAHEQIDIIIKRAEKIRSKKLKKLDRDSDIANLSLSIFLILLTLLIFRRVIKAVQEFEDLTKNLAVNSILTKVELDDKNGLDGVSENMAIFTSNIKTFLTEHEILIKSGENEIKNLKLEINKLQTSSKHFENLLSKYKPISKKIESEIKLIFTNLENNRLKSSINMDSDRGTELIVLIKESVETIEQLSRVGSNNFKLLSDQIRDSDNQKINYLAEIGESIKKIDKTGENESLTSILQQIYKDIELWSKKINEKEEILRELHLILTDNANNSTLISTNTTNLDNKFQTLMDNHQKTLDNICVIEKVMLDWNKNLIELFKNIDEVKDLNFQNREISLNSSSSIVKLEELHKKIGFEISKVRQ